MNSGSGSASGGAVRPIVHSPPGTVTVRPLAPAPFAGMCRLVRQVTLTSVKDRARGIKAGTTRPELVAREIEPRLRL